MLKKIIIAGFGGQGVISLGRFLGEVAITEGYNATYLPSYGPEMRGGTAHCMVNVSDKPIANPYVDNPDICLLFTEAAVEKFVPRMSPRGFAIVNGSLIDSTVIKKHAKRHLESAPLTEAARKIGSTKVMNVVGLSFLLKKERILQPEHVESLLRQKFADDPKTLELNIKALYYFLK